MIRANTCPTILLDACVLYSFSLRDILIRLAITGLYIPKWTDKIHEEWSRALLKNNTNISVEKNERVKFLMNQAMPDACIEETLFSGLIPILSIPDPNDRHVLAAAIIGKCNYILTFNLKDFPNRSLEKYGIYAISPDHFLYEIAILNIGAVIRCLKQQAEILKHPKLTPKEIMLQLHKTGLKKSADYIIANL